MGAHAHETWIGSFVFEKLWQTDIRPFCGPVVIAETDYITKFAPIGYRGEAKRKDTRSKVQGLRNNCTSTEVGVGVRRVEPVDVHPAVVGVPVHARDVAARATRAAT